MSRNKIRKILEKNSKKLYNQYRLECKIVCMSVFRGKNADSINIAYREY